MLGSAGFAQIANTAINATVTPATVLVSTKTVVMTIVINDYFSSSPAQLSGCTVTFQGALSKRPN